MERYSISLRSQSACWKIQTRITPNTDTFQAVVFKKEPRHRRVIRKLLVLLRNLLSAIPSRHLLAKSQRWKILCEICSKSSVKTPEQHWLRPLHLLCLWTCNFIKKETPTQLFSCEIWEISKNNYFKEYLRTTASDQKEILYKNFI